MGIGGILAHIGLRPGEKILLDPEPTNPADPNAVKVRVERDGKTFDTLGYLPRDLAARIVGEASEWAGWLSIIWTKRGEPCGFRIMLCPADQYPENPSGYLQEIGPSPFRRRALWYGGY